MIPILLTLGVVLPAVAVMSFLADSTSPYSLLSQSGIALAMLLMGVVLLGLGVFMMLQVRHELQR